MKRIVVLLSAAFLGFQLMAPVPLEAKHKKHHDKKEKDQPKKESKEEKTAPKPCGCGKR